MERRIMPKKGEPYYKAIVAGGIPVVLNNRKPPQPPPRTTIKIRPIQKPPEPTAKQLKAKENYIAMGATPDVKRQAGEAAGYHPNAAIRGVNSAIRPIVGILHEKGVDDDLIADKIKDGLEAMHPMAPKHEDHNVRHKFVQEYNRLSGNYPPKEVKSEERKVVLHITGEDVRQSTSVDRIREEND
jgi:hypothetical protein